MYCPSCGFENPALSLFCRDCLNELHDPSLHECYERVNVDRLTGACREISSGATDQDTFHAVLQDMQSRVEKSLSAFEKLHISDSLKDGVSAQREAVHLGLTLFLQGLGMMTSPGAYTAKERLIESLAIIEAGNHSLNNGISFIAREQEEEHQSRAVFGSAWLDAADRQIGR